MTVFKIEKNIPPPPKRAGRAPVFPFAQLKVGESFVVPAEQSAAASASAHYNGRKYGRTFQQKRNPDGSVRFWRVA